MRYNQYTLCNMAMVCIMQSHLWLLLYVHTAHCRRAKLQLKHVALKLLFSVYVVKLPLFCAWRCNNYFVNNTSDY